MSEEGGERRGKRRGERKGKKKAYTGDTLCCFLRRDSIVRGIEGDQLHQDHSKRPDYKREREGEGKEKKRVNQ